MGNVKSGKLGEKNVKFEGGWIRRSKKKKKKRERVKGSKIEVEIGKTLKKRRVKSLERNIGEKVKRYLQGKERQWRKEEERLEEKKEEKAEFESSKLKRQRGPTQSTASSNESAKGNPSQLLI